MLMKFNNVKAFLFDLFGTLVDYNLDNEVPVKELFRSLMSSGINFTFDVFRNAYAESRNKYRKIRNRKIIFLTNMTSSLSIFNRLINYCCSSIFTVSTYPSVSRREK